MKRTPAAHSQRGATTMLIALMVLMSLALIGITGTRLAMTQHRISGNAARQDAAFAAAEAGVQNALAYLRPNRSLMTVTGSGGWNDSSSAAKWRDCDTNDTELPCGNGTPAHGAVPARAGVNLYSGTWRRYGPIPNQSTGLLNGNYAHNVDTWVLSNTLSAADKDLPTLMDCTVLNLTGTPAALSATVMGTVNAVNTLLALLGPIVGSPRLQPQVCLPVNFSQMPWGTWPSAANPSLTLVSWARSDDVAGGEAVVQQVVATGSLFAHLPPAAIMANGTVSLSGDIRVWGNMRPPTVSPMDFSVLNLNNVGPFNVTSAMNTLVGGNAAALASKVNLSFAPTLNVTSSDILGFDWNVTFPLSIWSAANTSFGFTNYSSLGVVSSARTCYPPWGGSASSTCLPLSQNARVTYLALLPQTSLLEMPDVQDPVNIVSTISGLIGSTIPAFPADLFDFTFGYPSASSSRIQDLATAAGNCSSIAAGGFYWVTGDCALAGSIGSSSQPVTIVATGNLSFGNNTDFYGVIYLRGSSAKTITGYNSGQRPTIHGAILSEGATNTGSNSFNVVYDVNAIRRAGYLNGRFTPVPGGWNDTAAGP